MISNSKLVLFFSSIFYIIVSSILIPTDLTADGNFHMASIFCSTQNTSLCRKDILNNEYSLIGNIMPQRCQQTELKYRNPECETNKNTWNNYIINTSQYPKIYYSLMSNVVIESKPKISIFLIRILNSSPFVVIAVLIWQMIGRNLSTSYSIGHLFMSGIWGAQYYFTFNPSSWLLLSFTSIPFFLLGMIEEKRKTRRSIFSLVILILVFLILNSRPDGKYWLSLLLICTLIYLTNHFKKMKSNLIFGVVSVLVVFVGLLLSNIPVQVYASYQGFEYQNSYTDNYPITKYNLIIHNFLMFPLFNLGYFGLDNSLENIIPSLIFAFPMFILFLILIKYISGMRRVQAYVIFLLLVTFFIYILFFQLNYLFIYDKNIGYRYFIPIVILASILAISKRNEIIKIQVINPISIFISLFTVLGLLLNITKASQGFNKGIYFSLTSEYFNLNEIYVFILLLTLGVTHYYLLRNLITHRFI
jgi:hypothetical protein